MQVCQAMWQALDPEIREHIDGVRVLAVVMDSSTDLGELPVESSTTARPTSVSGSESFARRHSAT